MKKLAIALGLSMAVAGSAHAGERGARNLIVGQLTVEPSCWVDIGLDQANRTMTRDEVHDGAVIAKVSLTPVCDGKVWINYRDQRDGYGVLKSVDGIGRDGAMYIDAAGAWANDHQHYILNDEGTTGRTMTYTVRMSNHGDGLPEAGHAYIYALETGMWQD